METFYDDRNRQDKALLQWERQKAAWTKMQQNLAAKIGKEQSVVLPGMTHHHRMRQEESSVIDSSVPPEVKNGVNSWEMTLRSGNGGVRFVQIGKAFPYPLYCPIRDADFVKPDSNTLMRVIPDHVPPRHKPVAECQYFHDRNDEYRRQIKKRFAHFIPDQEPMLVVGTKPPVTAQRIDECGDVEPVSFFEPLINPSPARAVTVYAEEPRSRPLSAVQKSSENAVPSPQSGPMLCFSASHLSVTSTPGETAQATLTVDNIGTTAVYYNWTSVVTDNQETSDFFRLSDPMNGVMLPEEQKFFTFSLRAPAAGVYSRQYELLTVPAGKERIIVNLRGVVLSADENDVATVSLERAIAVKASRDDCRKTLECILWESSENNAFTQSDALNEQRTRAQRAADKLHEQDLLMQRQAAVWNHRNQALGGAYNCSIYAKIEDLFQRYQTFQSAINPQDQETASVPWNGSLKSFYEDISLIRDSIVRSNFTAALNELVRASQVVQSPTEDLRLLFLRLATRTVLCNAADEMQSYAAVARDLAEGRQIRAKTDASKTDAKGGKAPPAKAAKGKTVVAEVKSETIEAAKPPDFDAFFVAGSRLILSSAAQNMFALLDESQRAVDRVHAADVKVTQATRWESLVALQATAEADVDLAAEVTKGKKK
jgi:hypothetical protein